MINRCRVPLVAACLASIPLLSGCAGTLRALGLRHAPAERVAVRPAAHEPAAGALEQGRKALDAGQTGLAVELFQRALGSGQDVAPALNGMGVAYARLGRPDLARRFFEQAMAAEPANQSFRANLARLERLGVPAVPEGPAAALRAEAEPAVPVLAATASVDPRFKPLVRIDLSARGPRASLERVSPGEFRVTSPVVPGGARGAKLPVIAVRESPARIPAPAKAAQDAKAAGEQPAAPAAAETKVSAKTTDRPSELAGFVPLVRLDFARRAPSPAAASR